MLMPIPKGRTATAAVTALAVEPVQQQEKPTVTPGSISGRQSQVVLKILETLNRHLVGIEPLPREALVRLLDTLAKILKLPPLPEETLRDFGKRIAAFIELLPPAARAAVEKQLQQRNIGVSLSLLLEVLKRPGDAMLPRPPSPSSGLNPPATGFGVADTGGDGARRQDATIATSAQRLAASSPRVFTGAVVSPAASPASLAATLAPPVPLLATAAVNESGLLQIALKKVFNEDQAEAMTVQPAADGTVNRDTIDPARSGGAAPSGRKGADTDEIPLLRAAAAFLASDPEALALATAIAGGDIDRAATDELMRDLDLEATIASGSITAGLATDAEEQTIASMSSQEEPADDALVASASGDEQILVQGRPDRAGDGLVSGTMDVPVEDDFGTRSPVVGADGASLSRADAEQRDTREGTALENDPAHALATLVERPAKMLAETLKVLADAAQPLPDTAGLVEADILTQAMEKAGDHDALTAFAAFEATTETPDLHTLLQTKNGQTAAHSAELEHSETQTETEEQPSLGVYRPNEEHRLDLPASRLPEMPMLREAVPFILVPYLPASEIDAYETEIEKDHPVSDDDDGEGDGAEDEAGHGRQDDSDDGAQSNAGETFVEVPDEPDDTQPADIHDLYRRRGNFD